MRRFAVQFAYDEKTHTAGKEIGHCAVFMQALGAAQANAKREGRAVDIYEDDTELNRVVNRWRVFPGGGYVSMAS